MMEIGEKVEAGLRKAFERKTCVEPNYSFLSLPSLTRLNDFTKLCNTKIYKLKSMYRRYQEVPFILTYSYFQRSLSNFFFRVILIRTVYNDCSI